MVIRMLDNLDRILEASGLDQPEATYQSDIMGSILEAKDSEVNRAITMELIYWMHRRISHMQPRENILAISRSCRQGTTASASRPSSRTR